MRGGGYLIIICCNEQPSQATANPVGGKACSSTKGGLLRYILNTYSIHKVSSLKFAYYSTQYAAHTLHQHIFQREAMPSHFLFGCSKKNICQTVVKEICTFSTGNLPLLNLSSNSVARIPDRPFSLSTVVVYCERKRVIKIIK